MKIASQVLEQQAYEQVKQMILTGQLLAGEKIVQDKLAAELGISRTPLRAALQKLESENLIESIPRRGVRIKEFSDQEIIEIYDCRMALEGTAVRLFTENANEKTIKKLAKIFAPFQAAKKIKVETYRNADSQFHQFIISNCGNQFLNRIFTQSNMLDCINRIGLVRPPEETLGEHLAIIKAIENGNASLAQKHMIAHLERSKILIDSNTHES